VTELTEPGDMAWFVRADDGVQEASALLEPWIRSVGAQWGHAGHGWGTRQSESTRDDNEACEDIAAGQRLDWQ
jgi:hypothetical protein